MNSLGSERCWAEVDCAALRHNARLAQERIGPGTALLAVVKANGYGHGMVQVAEALREEAEIFGVANLHEHWSSAGVRDVLHWLAQQAAKRDIVF